MYYATNILKVCNISRVPKYHLTKYIYIYVYLYLDIYRYTYTYISISVIDNLFKKVRKNFLKLKCKLWIMNYYLFSHCLNMLLIFYFNHTWNFRHCLTLFRPTGSLLKSCIKWSIFNRKLYLLSFQEWEPHILLQIFLRVIAHRINSNI